MGKRISRPNISDTALSHWPVGVAVTPYVETGSAIRVRLGFRFSACYIVLASEEFLSASSGRHIMPRKPRVQFPGAVYHIVTRGDGRRELFHDEGHYERFTRGLSDEVKRSAWKVLAFCWMPNHIHLLLTTPEPNLSAGMQHWLSGYANWYAKRNRPTGHLFPGRYKSFLVEHESYYWTLSRYVHLNPCVGQRTLCDRPHGWKHSSYGGYAQKRGRLDFVDYED